MALMHMVYVDCTHFSPPPTFASWVVLLFSLLCYISIVKLVLLDSCLREKNENTVLKDLFQLLLQIKINEVADVNGLWSLSP